MSSRPLSLTPTAPTELSTLSLHDALPICLGFLSGERQNFFHPRCVRNVADNFCFQDRKSTRLNSSHVATSYAVFCLKKKNRHDDSRYWKALIVPVDSVQVFVYGSRVRYHF